MLEEKTKQSFYSALMSVKDRVLASLPSSDDYELSMDSDKHSVWISFIHENGDVFGPTLSIKYDDKNIFTTSIMSNGKTKEYQYKDLLVLLEDIPNKITINEKNVRTHLETVKEFLLTLQETKGKAIQMETKAKKRINVDLISAGMDGNGRFVKTNHALTDIQRILNKYGYDFTDPHVFSDYNTQTSSEGRKTFEISQGIDQETAVETKNSVFVTWSKMGDKFEIVAYIG